jgi:hypothetical protein
MSKPKIVKLTVNGLLETISTAKKIIEEFPNHPNLSFYKAQIKNCEEKLPSVKALDIKERTERLHERLKFAHPDGVEGWFEWAKKQYIIHPADASGIIRVESIIRDWEEEKSWEFTEQIDALEKVEKLVNWVRENRERGRGNCLEDVQKEAI